MNATQTQSTLLHRNATSRATRRRYLIFWLLVGPALLLRVLTAGYPFLQTIYLSLTNLDFINGTNDFVGLRNFTKLTSDFGIQSAVNFTLLFVVISTGFQLVLGVLIALLLNADFGGRPLVRAVNLIPWAIPGIVAAYTFSWLLDDQFGLLPHWVFLLTGVRPVVFVSATGARIATILVNVWKNTPFMAVVLLAGLQGVSEDLYDAGKVDGATAWQRFWRITLPLMRPLLISNGMFFIVWQMASFDLIYGLTAGGPGNATAVLALRIYQQGMLFFKFGFASAIGVVMLVLVGLVGLAGILAFRRYEVSL